MDTVNPLPVYGGGVIVNPKVPYSEKLSKYNPGDIIIINGDVPYNSNNFRIDLQEMTCDDQVADILLHVGVRFLWGTIVLNTRRGDIWQTEERPGDMCSLEPGKPFECFIMLHDDFFKIAFNGHHLADFEHRSPYSSADHLSIQGSVTVRSIQIQHGPASLEGRPQAMPYIKDSRDTDQPLSTDEQTEPSLPFVAYGLRAPYTYNIPGGMRPSRNIYVSGIVLDDEDDFTVNLISSYSKKDIAFHFNPRLALEAVVMNTMTAGRWGTEQRVVNRFPFRRGVGYDLMIVCQPDCYMISVNNQHYAQYSHRHTALEKITELEVTGCTRLIHIRMV